MQKIICYFESEAQCEAAVTALSSAGIALDAIRVVSDTPSGKTNDIQRIGSSAPFAQPDNLSGGVQTEEATYAQAPVAALLIRGDLFTFHDDKAQSLGEHAVEVCGDKATLELARDILLNLF